MKKIIYLIIVTLTFSTLSFANAYAETGTTGTTDCNVAGSIIPAKPSNIPGPCPKTVDKDGISRTLTSSILPGIAVFLIGIVGGVSILFLVIAGVRFSTAYGNEEDVQKAKNQAIYAVVGIVVALLSYVIVEIITKIEFQ